MPYQENTEPVVCGVCGLDLAIGYAYGIPGFESGSIYWYCAGCFYEED
jgi:hypothetical protein